MDWRFQSAVKLLWDNIGMSCHYTSYLAVFIKNQPDNYPDIKIIKHRILQLKNNDINMIDHF